MYIIDKVSRYEVYNFRKKKIFKMKTMFILMSHQMTEIQYSDAKKNLAIDEFINLSTDIWSQIPAEVESIGLHLEDLKHNIMRQSQKGDLLLVQGDFGATVEMVHFAFREGLIPVYATTKRIAKDIVDGDTVTTIRTFEHVRFRKYTRG